MNQNFWNGKTIVITGTSSGIGEAILNELKEISCTIFAIDRTTKDIPTSKAKIVQLQCDLTRSDELEKTGQEILKQTESVDVLFNNAGITAHGRFDEMKMEVFRKTFEINFFAAVHLTLVLIDKIKKSKGVVIVTSTVSGLYGIPGRSAYSSSKSALHAAFESLRIELSEFGVRSIIFCPPYTKTALRTSGLDSKGNKLNEEQAKGKIKTPKEVAEAMILAVEDKNSRLVTMDKSGFYVKWLRLFAPAFLEKQLFKKLYHDFH
ncbi:MAG: SDR family NAD(P)-dependent oxidoreductase [Leptospiraceae bacterium]|nr:SDR family NAD(P)-dependent oxidoreductase [Leptospiraceae bacterium]